MSESDAMMSEAQRFRLEGCLVCGQVNEVPAVLESVAVARCRRCGSDLQLHFDAAAVVRRTLTLCLLALAFLVPGFFLPLVRIEKFGHAHATGILSGCRELFAGGDFLLGAVILVCSILLPLCKLGCITLLCLAPERLSRSFRTHLYLFIEYAGRWGTLDVLVLAALVAMVKLGRIVSIIPGSGALVFSIGVLLSLAASSSFNPRLLWHGPRR